MNTAPLNVLDAASELLSRNGRHDFISTKTNEPIAWDMPIPLTDGDRPAFPTQHLPSTLRHLVESLSIATQTPPALAAMLGLAVIAAASAKRMTIEVRRGWWEPLNIFVIASLPPANRKSAVFSAIAQPLERYEKDEAGRVAAVIAQDQNQRKILEKRLETAQRDAATSKSSDDALALRSFADDLAKELHESPPVTLPRLIVDDVSPEKLANLLADRGGRMAVLSAEGGLFETIAGRYSQNNTPNLDVFLKGHSGDTLRVDRIGRAPDFVEQPALTIGLAVQPEVLRGLAAKPGLRGRGMLARLWYGVLESTVGRRQIAPPPVSDDVLNAYDQLVRAVLTLPPATSDDGRPCAHRLHLDDDAAALFLAFEATLEPQLGDGGELAHIADWGGKLAGAVARLAAILHIADMAGTHEPWSRPVNGSTMRDAIAIATDFLVPHALLAFGEMGSDPEIEHAQVVLQWLERQSESIVSKRDIHQQLKRRFQRAHDLDPALAVLVERGYLRELPSTEREEPRGRKPSPRYEINPLTRSHNSPCSQKGTVNGHSEDSEDFENASTYVEYDVTGGCV